MIGIALALLSAASSGLSVILVSKYSKKSSAFNISLVISCVGMAVLWPIAILLTDFRTVNVDGVLIFAICGVLSPGIVRLLYYKGLKSLGTAVNSSIVSVYPLYTSLLAVLLLSEILTVENWLGIVCVVFGIILVENSSKQTKNGEKLSKIRLIVPILGGLSLGVASIIRKYGLNIFDAPVLGVAIGYTFSLLPYAMILMFSAPTRRALSPKRDTRFFWKAGVGQAVSWITAFYALSYEKVSIVTPLISIEPVFVILFAYLYLRGVEHISSKLVASIVLTVIGVVLVTIY